MRTGSTLVLLLALALVGFAPRVSAQTVAPTPSSGDCLHQAISDPAPVATVPVVQLWLEALVSHIAPAMSAVPAWGCVTLRRPATGRVHAPELQPALLVLRRLSGA